MSNGNGNGNKTAVETIASSVMMIALSRITSVIGVPVAVVFLGWAAASFSQMSKDIVILQGDVKSLVAVQKIINANQDRRLDWLEKN